MSGVTVDTVVVDSRGFIPQAGYESFIDLVIGGIYVICFLIAIYIRCKHHTGAFVNRALVYLIISLGIRLLMSLVNEKKTKTTQTEL